MKQMKTILGTFLIAVLLVVTRAEASTVHYMQDQSNKHDDGIDHHWGTVSDHQHGQHDFLPSEKWKAHDNNERHGDIEGQHDGFGAWHDGHEGRHAGHEGRHDGFDGWHDGHEGWRAGYKGSHDGFDGWGDGHEGWHHKNWEFCHEKPVPPVPVPAAFWLFGSGMLLLGRIASRRRA
jgi:hypothetical protein